MTEHVAPPNSREAEESVVALLLAHPSAVNPVVAEGLRAEHFWHAPARLVYEQVVEAYYADEPVDPLTIGESLRAKLAKMWNCPKPEAAERVVRLGASRKLEDPELALAHAKLVRRHADSRKLLDLATAVQRSVDAGDEPESVAGKLGEVAMRIATGTALTAEIESYGDVGRRFVRETERAIAARRKGIEIGVHFGLRFIDGFTNGIRGSELMFVAGEPGVGKSALLWSAARAYAHRQMARPEDGRIGTLVLSLEMAENPTAIRLAQMLTQIDGQRVRRGDVSQAELSRVTAAWAAGRDLPLYFNFASMLTVSQLRAIVVNAVRRQNVGLVILDHFGYVTMDDHYSNPIQEDEDKARFLKESVAKDLDVVVACIAHTTKSVETEDGRPTLRHLRGSGQIGAHADFVAFMYRPWMRATETQKLAGSVKASDAELIFAKNRHGEPGTSPFHFDPKRMEVRDP